MAPRRRPWHELGTMASAAAAHRVGGVLVRSRPSPPLPPPSLPFLPFPPSLPFPVPLRPFSRPLRIICSFHSCHSGGSGAGGTAGGAGRSTNPEDGSRRSSLVRPVSSVKDAVYPGSRERSLLMPLGGGGGGKRRIASNWSSIILIRITSSHSRRRCKGTSANFLLTQCLLSLRIQI